MNFSDELISWYLKYKRDLPWRNTSDPYQIWLSEIILQQTRVEQGMPYYLKFLEAFPDVKSFAAASEDEILRLWQGLGYYSRGRNMLKTAIKIMEDFSGNFPTSYHHLIKLTGIGEYTAAAISSFAANEAKAVVDGNVYRLLARHYGVYTPINSTIGKKTFQALADELINPDNAGEHNQAMIEFGALQCKPKNPNCEICPFLTSCYAYQHQKVAELPVKLKKLKIKERFFFFFLVELDSKILMRRRTNNDIWAGLHDLPSLEFTEQTDFNRLSQHPDYLKLFDQNIVIHSISDEVKHILTHQIIFARFVHVDKINMDYANEKKWIWVNIKDLDQYGQPKLIFDYLKKFIN